MQDGLASNIATKDRATEDFITVDGVAHKLDQTRFDYSWWGLGSSPEKMTTLVNHFPENHCEL
jgi:hypothetical protein